MFDILTISTLSKNKKPRLHKIHVIQLLKSYTHTHCVFIYDFTCKQASINTVCDTLKIIYLRDTRLAMGLMLMSEKYQKKEHVIFLSVYCADTRANAVNSASGVVLHGGSFPLRPWLLAFSMSTCC